MAVDEVHIDFFFFKEMCHLSFGGLNGRAFLNRQMCVTELGISRRFHHMDDIDRGPEILGEGLGVGQCLAAFFGEIHRHQNFFEMRHGGFGTGPAFSMYEDGSARVSNDTFGSAAEQDMLQPRVAMGGDDDQVMAPFFCCLSDFLGRDAGDDIGSDAVL